MLRYLILLGCCLTALFSRAQGTFSGKVFEYKTHIALNNIWIENLSNKQNTLSDKNGKFSIPVKNGDLVLFKGFAYRSDTVLITGSNASEVFLEPQTIPLNQVDVTATELGKKINVYSPEFHGQPVVYHRDYKGNYDGGITIRLHYWKKGERDKAKLEQKLKNFDTADRINALFTPENIGKYVPLKGEDLDNFISLYTPTVKQFSRNDFTLLQYLNDSYKRYQDLPPDKRKPQPIAGQR